MRLTIKKVAPGQYVAAVFDTDGQLVGEISQPQGTDKLSRELAEGFGFHQLDVFDALMRTDPERLPPPVTPSEFAEVITKVLGSKNPNIAKVARQFKDAIARKKATIKPKIPAAPPKAQSDTKRKAGTKGGRRKGSGLVI